MHHHWTQYHINRWYRLKGIAIDFNVMSVCCLLVVINCGKQLHIIWSTFLKSNTHLSNELLHAIWNLPDGMKITISSIMCCLPDGLGFWINHHLWLSSALIWIILEDSVGAFTVLSTSIRYHTAKCFQGICKIFCPVTFDPKRQFTVTLGSGLDCVETGKG